MNSTEHPQIQNVSAAGRPVKRIPDVLTARSVYNDFKTHMEPKARQWARIKAVVGGNRPFDAAELTRLGQSWRANINSRESRAMKNQIVSAAWELHFESPTLIEVELTPMARAVARLDPDLEEHVCQVVAEEYTKTLFDWPGMYSNVHVATDTSTEVGLGFMVWPDPWDWRPRAYHPGYLKLKPWASVNIEEQDIACVDIELEIADLFRYALFDDDTAKLTGWNPAAVRKFLVSVFREGLQNADGEQPMDPWLALQQKYQNNDASVLGKQYQKLKITVVLVMEFDDANQRWGVSQLLMPQDTGPETADAQFLFERRSMYPKFRNVLWFLPYEYGDGYLDSVKGFGHDVFAYAEYSNRFLCQALDGGMLAASVVLQTKSGINGAVNSAVRSGPFTFLAPEVTMAATQFRPDVGGLMELRQVMQSVLHNNTGVYKPRPEFQRDTEAPKTARQVVSEESREARFEKNRARLAYVQWRLWHQEIFRRLTEPAYLLSPVDLPGVTEARNFFARCVARGVPQHLLLSNTAFDIHVSQAVGLGSAGAKMDITNQLMAARPSMAERGRRYVERLWGVARGLSWRQVDIVFPMLNQPERPTAATGIATLEGNDFSEGKTVPVSSEDLHAAHVTVHLSQLMQIAQAFKEAPQNMDIPGALATFQANLPHTEQHLAYLAQDPTRAEQVEQFQQIFEAGVALFKQLQQSADRIVGSQKQLEQQRQVMLQKAMEQLATKENEVELAVAQRKVQIEEAKQASINDIRKMREETQQALKAQRQQFEMALAAQKQDFEQRLAVRKQDLESAVPARKPTKKK